VSDYEKDLLMALEKARAATVDAIRFTRFMSPHTATAAEDAAREITGLLAAMRMLCVLGQDAAVPPAAEFPSVVSRDRIGTLPVAIGGRQG
jgi:hypothetical protein